MNKYKIRYLGDREDQIIEADYVEIPDNVMATLYKKDHELVAIIKNFESLELIKE